MSSPDTGAMNAANPRREILAAAAGDALRATSLSQPLQNVKLEQAVRPFAPYARQPGVPPERMLIVLAAIMRDSSPVGDSDWWRAIARDRLVVWASDGYYQIFPRPSERGAPP